MKTEPCLFSKAAASPDSAQCASHMPDVFMHAALGT